MKLSIYGVLLILLLFVGGQSALAQGDDCADSLTTLRETVQRIETALENDDPDAALAVLELIQADIDRVETACSQESYDDLSADELVDAAFDAYLDDDMRLALRLINQALETPDSISRHPLEQVYAVQGNIYMELDDYENAILAQDQALEINPDYYNAWVNRGIAYRLSGDLDEAEASYLQALALEPEYAELRASLGALYIFRGEPEKAVIELEYAIELDPQLAISHANIALAYAMLERFDEADAALMQAIVLGYRNADTVRERIDELREQTP